MSSREWSVLISYFSLMLLFVVGIVMVSVFPFLGSSFPLWMGPLFVVMGAHLIHFRNDHAGIWERWGGPSQSAFLMIGLFFLGIGVFFIAGAF